MTILLGSPDPKRALAGLKRRTKVLLDSWKRFRETYKVFDVPLPEPLLATHIRSEFQGPRPYINCRPDAKPGPMGWIWIRPLGSEVVYRGVCLGQVPIGFQINMEETVMIVRDRSEPIFLIQETGQTILDRDCEWAEIVEPQSPVDFSPFADPNFNPCIPKED
jgi:hypothetical protein